MKTSVKIWHYHTGRALSRLQEKKGEQLTNRENETPPPHIKRKSPRNSHHNQSDYEPDSCKPPQDDPEHDPDNIKHIACIDCMRQSVYGKEEALGQFAQ